MNKRNINRNAVAIAGNLLSTALMIALSMI
jgi:hypothetical protein